jgi:hypothetical protein
LHLVIGTGTVKFLIGAICGSAASHHNLVPHSLHTASTGHVHSHRRVAA